MNGEISASRTPTAKSSRRAAKIIVLLAFQALISPAYAQLQPDPGESSNADAKPDADDPRMLGHGTLSISYENTYVNGMLLGGPVTPIGTLRVQSVDFLLDYFIADHWSIVAGIPFTTSRFEAGPGNAPHCPTATAAPVCGPPTPALLQPHPESEYLDDGNSHGTWADWTFGVEYHANVLDYIITPSINAYIPSHNYVFFANAAVGQDLKRVEVGATIAHQFDFSNFYYRIGYRRAFVQRTLGVSIDNNKYDVDVGYFVNEKLSLNIYGLGKFGGGLTGDQLIPLTTFNGVPFVTEYWYRHDQIAAHEYVNVGTGVEYRLNDKTTLSTSIDRLVWGNSVYDFKYRLDVTLAREF